MTRSIEASRALLETLAKHFTFANHKIFSFKELRQIMGWQPQLGHIICAKRVVTNNKVEAMKRCVGSKQ